MTCARCGALLPNVTNAETLCNECKRIMANKIVQVPCSSGITGTAGSDAFWLYKEVMEELKSAIQANDLRDQFAMAALQGITANTGIINGRIVEDIAWLTETCYAVADAMIKERGA